MTQLISTYTDKKIHRNGMSVAVRERESYAHTHRDNNKNREKERLFKISRETWTNK